MGHLTVGHLLEINVPRSGSGDGYADQVLALAGFLLQRCSSYGSCEDSSLFQRPNDAPTGTGRRTVGRLRRSKWIRGPNSLKHVPKSRATLSNPFRSEQ